VFTHTKQVSVTVMILFDKTLPISILTQLPPLKNMHTHIHTDPVASPKNVSFPVVTTKASSSECFLVGFKKNDNSVQKVKLLLVLTT